MLLFLSLIHICHSDYDLMAGKYILPLHFPIIPGHEFCAEVVELGANVTSLKVGDRVVGECNIGCGTCPVCQEIAGFCPNANHFGFTQDGADAEFVKADAGWLHKIPDTMDNISGAMVETFSIAYKGFREAGGVDASDICVIYGGGSIGACAAAVSHSMGAFTIVVAVSYTHLLFAGTNEDVGIRNNATITGVNIEGSQGDYDDQTISNKVIGKSGQLTMDGDGYYTGDVTWTVDVNKNLVDLGEVDKTRVIDELSDDLVLNTTANGYDAVSYTHLLGHVDIRRRDAPCQADAVGAEKGLIHVQIGDGVDGLLAIGAVVITPDAAAGNEDAGIGAALQKRGDFQITGHHHEIAEVGEKKRKLVGCRSGIQRNGISVSYTHLDVYKRQSQDCAEH